MKIKSLRLTHFPPISNFEIKDLGNTVVIAGANGAGKSRLKQALVGALQGNPVMDLVVEATRPEEEGEKYFGASFVSMTKGQPNPILKRYMNSRSFGRGRYVGSLVQIDSDRSVRGTNYRSVNWLAGDPDDSDTAWNFYFSPFSNRWQDFVNYIHQKTAARGKKISDAVLKDPQKTGNDWILEFPNPLDKYKNIFRNALPGKELLDIDPKKPGEFRYRDQSGEELNFTTLSSGEQEVIKVLFDVARKDIRHSIVIVDEPELHLHPTLAFQLIESLKALGNHSNQFIFLTHSSDLITTYFSSGDVYFIDSRNDVENQAHRVSDLMSSHNELMPLIGQNIGLFAVGKKIVFVEGEESSIDRLTYQRIAQKVDKDIRVIPTGSVLNISTLAAVEEQIRKSIFGLEFYMIRDRDGLTEDQIRSLERHSRIRCLKRRHIENYFLDPEILFRVSQVCYLTSKRPELSKEFIETEIQSIAQKSIPFNLYKSVCETLSVSHFLKGPRIKNAGTLCADEIKRKLMVCVSESLDELTEDLAAHRLDQWISSETRNLERTYDSGEWVRDFNGKYIFQQICGRVLKEDPLRVREAYVDVAIAEYPQRLSELIDLFKSM